MLCKPTLKYGFYFSGGNRPVYPGDKSFSVLVTALQLLSLGLCGGGLEMGRQGRCHKPKRNNLVFSDVKFFVRSISFMTLFKKLVVSQL